MKSFEDYVKAYSNTAEVNDSVFKEFTRKTDEIGYLKHHRDHVEANKLGFGDRAFQFMWFLILNHLGKGDKTINALEIGVFKGQIISLWSLIAKENNINININAITPLQGNPVVQNRWFSKIYSFISTKYRKDSEVGNHYDQEDYMTIIQKFFKVFELDFGRINLIRGFSTEEAVLAQTFDMKFDLIYVDGDHSYEGVKADIENYSGKLNAGGLLVMDDASNNIPGAAFWKGHQAVSDACETIDANVFKNILNVGHNRIFQKIDG